MAAQTFCMSINAACPFCTFTKKHNVNYYSHSYHTCPTHLAIYNEKLVNESSGNGKQNVFLEPFLDYLIQRMLNKYVYNK